MVDAFDATEKDYQRFVESCEKKGFTIDSKKEDKHGLVPLVVDVQMITILIYSSEIVVALVIINREWAEL